jgi:predicted nucleic acid-binding protein
MVEITPQPTDAYIEQAIAIVVYKPDAYVLAEAISSEPDWFITHDKVHFLSANPDSNLTFRIGTPGDLIQSLENEFTQS